MLHHTTAIIDTGASNHYFTTTAPLLGINMAVPPTTIRTATGKSRTSMASVLLTIPGSVLGGVSTVLFGLIAAVIWWYWPEGKGPPA